MHSHLGAGGAISVLEALRCETRALHERVERCIPLLSPDASQRDYADYLEKMWGFQRPLEAAFRALPELAALDLDARCKRGWLEHDLRALGHTPQQIASLPACVFPTHALELPEALGAMYVLEGATLGGQVLLRALRQRWPRLVERAGRFLHAYGASTGARWRDFVCVLEELGNASPSSPERVARAGRHTFERLLLWLEPSTAPREGERAHA